VSATRKLIFLQCGALGMVIGQVEVIKADVDFSAADFAAKIGKYNQLKLYQPMGVGVQIAGRVNLTESTNLFGLFPVMFKDPSDKESCIFIPSRSITVISTDMPNEIKEAYRAATNKFELSIKEIGKSPIIRTAAASNVKLK